HTQAHVVRIAAGFDRNKQIRRFPDDRSLRSQDEILLSGAGCKAAGGNDRARAGRKSDTDPGASDSPLSPFGDGGPGTPDKLAKPAATPLGDLYELVILSRLFEFGTALFDAGGRHGRHEGAVNAPVRRIPKTEGIYSRNRLLHSERRRGRGEWGAAGE